MPGIEDVQPKTLSTMGQQLVAPVAPAVTQDSVQKLIDGFRSGYITASDVVSRNMNLAKSEEELQLLREQTSPEMAAARQETAKAAAEKAMADRETSLTKDFIGAYLKYNLPLKTADGKPDYSGMAEVGQKYADMERMLKYSEMGSMPAGQPRVWIDETGQHTAVYNAFGEDITQVPGKPNRILEEHQKNARKARAFLLQNDNEPDIPEGGEPPQIQVTPKQAAPAPAPAPVRVAPVSVRKADQGTTGRWSMTHRLKSFPAPAQVQVAPVAPAPAVVPIAPTAPAAKPVLDYVPGTGYVSGPGTFKPDEYLKDIRGLEIINSWNNKKPIIDDFRATVQTYKANPTRAITTQDDIALATDALLLAAPGASAGGRGMEAMKITRLEDAQPVLEQLYGIKGHILKEHVFEKGTRDRLIAATERRINAIEGAARGTIQSAAERLTKAGVDPNKYLIGPEKDLLQGTTSAPVTSGGTATRQITLSNGKIVTVTAKQ